MENVGGSEALVWNSSEEISRASRNAATSPIATPASASIAPLRITICRMFSWPAPSAMRMPISCVRCATAYDITP